MRDDDELTAEEDAKDDLAVLRESLVLLNKKIDRMAFEASDRIATLEARVKALETRTVPIEDYNDD